MSQWISSSFDTIPVFEELGSETRKRKSVKNNFSEIPRTCDKDTWVQKHAPKVLEDLAVHKKKVQEVEIWITENISTKKGGAPLLLLTGPSGCGKTATLMVVAKKHSIEVEEWSNPMTTPFNVSCQIGLDYESETNQFEKFLFRSGKYNSVLSNPCFSVQGVCLSKKLILLEELPNFLYRDPSKIVQLIRKYRITQRWPLVLILSDGVSTDLLKRHLRNLSNHLFTINFNSISTSIMTKVLTRICLVEHQTVSKDDINTMSSTGDIRAAINCLQFSCKQDKSNSLKKHKSNKHDSRTSCLAAKDSNMVLFRALGKIFYCKRDKLKSTTCIKFGKNYRDPLVIQPETILDQCCLSGSSFSLFLHQNYLSFFENNSVNDITAASDYLSFADTMNLPQASSDPSSGSSIYLDQYEGILAIRGLTFSNSSRATADLCSSSSGSWKPMHKPTWYDVRRQEQENRVTSHCLFWKQKDDLPMLVHLSSKFEPSQKNFIREVIAIPKWKSFRSHNDRLNERETGNELPEEEKSLDNDICVKVTDENEEDLIIEEFSD